MPTKFTASFERISHAPALKQRLNTLAAKAVYVGIPAGSARQRQEKLLRMAGRISTKTKSGRKRKERLESLAGTAITNAELLFIFSKGSPRRNQPPRPVLEPAVQAEGNREPIAAELAEADRATLAGNTGEATRHLQRAGVKGANAARGWFTDPRNGWPQNALSTIRQKLGKLTGKRRRKALAILDSVAGFGYMPTVGRVAALDEINTPGIDTGAMRQAITWLIKNEATDTIETTESESETTTSVSQGGEEAATSAADAATAAGESIAEAGGEIVAGAGELAEGAGEAALGAL